MVLSVFSAGVVAAPQKAAAATPGLNTGNPFTNGDLYINPQNNTIMLSGSQVIVKFYHYGYSDGNPDGLTPTDGLAMPTWDVTSKYVTGSAPQVAGNNYSSPAYTWSADGGGWGCSDFGTTPYLGSWPSDGIFSSGLNVGVDLSQELLHCMQLNNSTTPDDLYESVGLYLYSMDYDSSTGIYDGTFYLMAFPMYPQPNGDTDVYGYQAAAGRRQIHIRWQDTVNIKLLKTSKNSAITDGNSCYSLDGAKYGIYRTSADADADTNIVTSVTLSGDGSSSTATTGDLVPGTYYIKELTAPKGYILDKTIYTVAATTGGETYSVSIADVPGNDPLGAYVYKVDAETGKQLPVGGASLAGAQFTVKYYDGYYSTAAAATASGAPTKTWVYKTKANGTFMFQDQQAYVSGDPLYKDTYGNITMPLGTYVYSETMASPGYLLPNNPTVFVTRVIYDSSSDYGYTVEGDKPGSSEGNIGNSTTVQKEQVKRGDLDLIKAAAVSYTRMAGIPFKITSNTTGESHVIITDANGYASTSNSWNPHDQNTNAGATADDGVWFGKDSAGNIAPVNDQLGALPYDTYTIEELPCPANTDYNLIPPFTVTISRDNYTVSLGTLTDQKPEVPVIGTTAKDGDSGTQTVIDSKTATIVDTVAYKNLTPGKEYTVTGTLMDQSTDTTLTVNGAPVTASATFTPTSADGSVDVTFTFDASALAGKSVVVFEDLYLGNIKVAVHEDITDGGQTVAIVAPTMHTTAHAAGSDDKTVYADSPVTITDTITYSNLVVGKQYTATGKLVNKDTSATIAEVTKTFTPSAPDGTVDIDFTIDARALAGKSVVVFETISRNDEDLVFEADINDVDQTVDVIAPALKTNAATKDGSKVTLATKKTTITDTVTYTGLAPGKPYTLIATLMDKATGKPVIVNGKTITAKKTFTPETSNGKTTIDLTFDATQLGGHDVVVFEDLYRGDVKVGLHADINDVGQTVKLVAMPKIPAAAPKKMPKTGDQSTIPVVAGVIGLILIAALIFVIRHQLYRRLKRDNSVSSGADK